jgi:release factor glutamine methyltransferase
MDIFQAEKQLARELEPRYGKREAATIADWVMETLTGHKKLDRLTRKTDPLQPLTSYKKYFDELLAGRPVQYVLGECWFGGLRFQVDERVLIPRPETEELVEWVSNETRQGSILDIGTGSGCIAITLARKLPNLTIHAIDVSTDALAVAQKNAAGLHAKVDFRQLDFLDRTQWQNLPPTQYIVSNPPYIPLKEKETMAPHVTGSEPSLALFVPDNDALVFYRALGEFARQQPRRTLYAEIHESLAGPVRQLLQNLGTREVIVKKDMQGKDRMVKATW